MSDVSLTEKKMFLSINVMNVLSTVLMNDYNTNLLNTQNIINNMFAMNILYNFNNIDVREELNNEIVNVYNMYFAEAYNYINSLSNEDIDISFSCLVSESGCVLDTICKISLSFFSQ